MFGQEPVVRFIRVEGAHHIITVAPLAVAWPWPRLRRVCIVAAAIGAATMLLASLTNPFQSLGNGDALGSWWSMLRHGMLMSSPLDEAVGGHAVIIGPAAALVLGLAAWRLRQPLRSASTESTPMAPRTRE